ncbi:MAG: hypothetical protein ACPHN2_10455 [Sinimarinibacterium flocculans]|uniref:hypothetical protein n=1 Tax=Sinimarinibacterium flocculans TaxID=985250 RepID=UPI003C544757
MSRAPRAAGLAARLREQWRQNPKLELWLAWWTMVVFYQIFGIVFVLMTRVMPPPKPWWEPERVAQWFADTHDGLVWGFGIIFLISFMAPACNALIGYSMRRMSVSPVFAYSYIAIYSVSAFPGMLLAALLLCAGALRPDRDPQIISWLYDAAFMTFVGTMGLFLVGTAVWMVAILLDKNRVFPLWFGYLNICNLLTEVVVAPAWIFKAGPFAWNGVITFWIDTLVFAVYTAVFITLLRRMTVRDDLREGPLPETPQLATTASLRF